MDYRKRRPAIVTNSGSSWVKLNDCSGGVHLLPPGDRILSDQSLQYNDKYGATLYVVVGQEAEVINEEKK